MVLIIPNVNISMFQCIVTSLFCISNLDPQCKFGTNPNVYAKSTSSSGCPHTEVHISVLFLSWQATVAHTDTQRQSHSLHYFLWRFRWLSVHKCDQTNPHSKDPRIPVHYSDVIMGTMASLIPSLTGVVYSTVHPGADQRKHQSSTSLAFVWGIHRRSVNSRTNGQ